MPRGRSAGDDIAAELASWIDPDTARAMVRTLSDRVLGCRPHEIAPQDEARLLEALRPVLRTLLGEGAVEPAVARLERVCALSAARDRAAEAAPPADPPGRAG